MYYFVCFLGKDFVQAMTSGMAAFMVGGGLIGATASSVLLGQDRAPYMIVITSVYILTCFIVSKFKQFREEQAKVLQTLKK